MRLKALRATGYLSPAMHRIALRVPLVPSLVPIGRLQLVNFPVPALRLRMNSAHYDKMKELFRRACVKGANKSLSSWSSAAGAALGHRNSSGGGSGALPPAAWAGDFHDSLFACLMRYEALQVSRVLFLFVWFPFIRLVYAAAVCQ